MRPKLYLATKKVDVMFLFEGDDPNKLNKEAEHFLEQETKNYVQGRVVIKEISSKEEVPKDWWEANLWGIDDEINALQFLEDPEYLEYLRLKKKFEDK